MPCKSCFLLILFLPFCGLSQSDHRQLFPIRENGLWGFIDTTGKVVIPPRFLNAGDFSEGLAPVRIGGLYGYINTRGKIQIQARFHYAESFMNGIGKVWMNDEPFFINRKGEITSDKPRIKIHDGGNRLSPEPSFGNYVPFQIDGNKRVHFYNGQAVINTFSTYYEIIDSAGATISGLPKINYSIIQHHRRCIKPMGDFWMFTSGEEAIQVWNNKEKFFFQDLMYEVSLGIGHKNLLVRGCDYYGRITYYSHAGKVIWQEKPVASDENLPSMQLNVDEKLDHFPYSLKRVKKDMSSLSQDSLTAFIHKSDSTKCDRISSYPLRYAVFEGYFVNNTADTLFFREPYFGLEALDEQGKWRDILHHPRFACRTGNDWLRTLAPREAYQINIPDFDGEFETQLRLVVCINRVTSYSNPVKTRINPGQFWRSPVISRSKVLQPYTDSIWH